MQKATATVHVCSVYEVLQLQMYTVVIVFFELHAYNGCQYVFYFILLQ